MASNSVGITTFWLAGLNIGWVCQSRNGLWTYVTGGNFYRFQWPLTVRLHSSNDREMPVRWCCVRRLWRSLGSIETSLMRTRSESHQLFTYGSILGIMNIWLHFVCIILNREKAQVTGSIHCIHIHIHITWKCSSLQGPPCSKCIRSDRPSKRQEFINLSFELSNRGKQCVPSLRWRHNGRDSVSNHQPHDCLLHR